MGKKRSEGRKKDKDREKGKPEVKELGGRTRRFMPLVIFSFGVLLTVLAYVRSLHAPLIFDDLIFITPSKLEGAWRHFTLRVRSIAVFSFAVNYAFSGNDIAVFRATNVLLHLFAAGLAFYLTLLTVNLPHFKEKYGKVSVLIALAVAVLFMLHPIQTSAVNYLTQRMAIMAALFSFGGFIFYIRGVSTEGKRSLLHYTLSALSFGLAIFSKENAVMALLMLPVYDLFFLSSFRWREFRKRFIVLSVLVISLALITAYTMSIGSFIQKVITVLSHPDQPLQKYAWAGVDIHWTPIEYLLTELRVVSRYIFLIIVPFPSLMVFDYSNTYPVSKDLFHPLATLFSLLFLVSLLVFSLRNSRKTPLVSFGILWYLVTLSLESFIAFGLDPYFEHRNYLPSYGLFFAVASLLVYVDRPGLHIFKKIVIPVAAVLLFLATFARNGTWAKEELLWKDAVEKAPGNARALVNLSYGYIKGKRFQEAEEYLQKASTIQPITNSFRVDLRINQAALYKETGRRQEALTILKELEADGSLPKNRRSYVQFLIGDFLRMEGDFSGAKAYLEAAYRDKELRRDSPVLPITLGFVSRSLGETDKAEGYFLEAVRIDPTAIAPYAELGDLYLVGKDLEKAGANYRVIIKRGVGGDMGRRALFGLAQIALIRNENDKAEGFFEQVVKMAPAFYPTYIFLGDIRLRKNDPDGALFYLEKALSLEETFMNNELNAKLLYYHLGRAYLLKGDKKTARKNFEIFLSHTAGDGRLEKQIANTRALLAQGGT